MTYIVRWQRLEQGDCTVEKVHDFLLLVVVGVALRVHSTVASPVLVPLMLSFMSASRRHNPLITKQAYLPKALIITTLILPVLLHIRQRSISTCGF